MTRRIAIGDIHGCSTALQTILKEINPQSTDTIITLGDYVDRGPDSKGVIEQLMALSKVCDLVTLMGNHELMLMRAFDGKDELGFWLRYGGIETMASYGKDLFGRSHFTMDDIKDAIPYEHMSFIMDCVVYHEIDDHIFVHANYDWDAPMDKQTENASFWNHIEPNPPRPHISGKTVWVGHTAQKSREILDLEHVICLDTWANNKTGWLTAVNIDTRKVWQANQNGEIRSDSQNDVSLS